MNLDKAVRENDVNKVTKLLATNKVDAHEVDRYGWTALMYASHLGRKEIVKVLLEHDASPEHINRQNRWEWTALIYASHEGRKEIVGLLLECDANPNILNNVNQSAIDVARTEEIKELLLNWEPKGVKKAKGV